MKDPARFRGVLGLRLARAGHVIFKHRAGGKVGHGRDHLRSLGRGVVFGMGLAALGVGGGGVPDVATVTGRLTVLSFGRGQEREGESVPFDPP